jgi:hypothetical protein
VPELTAYYFLWTVIFLLINILWDIRSSFTERFHFSNLKNKTSTSFAAATFSSSFILFISAFNKPTRDLLTDNALPLVLAGLIGLLYSLAELCPYTKEQRDEAMNSSSANTPSTDG